MRYFFCYDSYFLITRLADIAGGNKQASGHTILSEEKHRKACEWMFSYFQMYIDLPNKIYYFFL